MGEGGLRDLIGGKPDQLPSPAEIDIRHRQWRLEPIAAAKVPRPPMVSRPVPSMSTSRPHSSAQATTAILALGALHPPIDRILLRNLMTQDAAWSAWKAAHDAGWSTFDLIPIKTSSTASALSWGNAL